VKLKRFLLFAGVAYYPMGGWEDFIDSFDTLEEAVACGKLRQQRREWWHVVDLEKGEVVDDDEMFPTEPGP
jgi:hypothetical protein